MLVEKLPHRLRRFFLQARQGGPTLQKGSDNRSVKAVKPLQDLREIHFELIGDAIGLGCSFIHQLASFFHQDLQFARLRGIRPQKPQPVPMQREQVQQNSSVLGIVFASGRKHGFAVVVAGGRMNGIQHQVLKSA